MSYYILSGKTPVKVDDFMTWVDNFQNQVKTVEYTKIGNVTISTVFLGLDHNYDGGQPILFETMVFGGEYGGHIDRYHTWEEAEKGHHKVCAMVLS